MLNKTLCHLHRAGALVAVAGGGVPALTSCTFLEADLGLARLGVSLEPMDVKLEWIHCSLPSF